ncbi:MAG: ribonuclease HII [Thermoplasmata archaeon]
MICGVDEAGRGPVIGPLVVAGVCLKEDKKLIEMKVKDSKRHTANRREELAKEIYKMGGCAVRVIPAEDIDALRTQMTMNVMEADFFSSIINELCSEGDTVYVDSASANEKNFARMIEGKLDVDVDLISEHKADDNYPVVSAASICAKVRRDEEVKKIEEKLGEDIGSGYPSDPNTRRFLKKWIGKKGELPPYVRRSWKTCQDLMTLHKTKKLDDF